MKTNDKVYLYIKQHSLTGVKYFGKTSCDNVESYTGSGKYWLAHIKKHGKEHVKTIWISEPFYDMELLQEFAIFVSEEFNIVNSSEWANLIVENGLDGAPKGVKREGAFRERNGMFGKSKEKNPFYGKKHSIEQKRIWTDMRLGDKNPNAGGKAFTQETLLKLRRPKANKQNYNGTPGKITCINKNGIAVQVTTEQYHSQKSLNIPIDQWEYVNTRSKEAARRKYENYKKSH